MTDEQPKDELIGKTLGQFAILQEVGRGGMATVYKSRQQSMNRIVAVKVLPRHLLHDPGFYERFEREVEVISALEHPHILPIYDYGQSDGVPYIAMRFLGGGSLEDQIRRSGPVDVADLERPLRQIAQALDYAHKQGIIHRDLKPGNIMLDEGGNAYLSDFGIARVMGSEMTGSMIIGTPSYMSPEQANGLPIDARADVYALGVVLFELITGRLPFQAETPMAVLLKHINEDVPPIADFRDDVSAVVENVVRKATAKDPDDRFSSAGDMALAFSAALRDETAVFDKPTERRAATKSMTDPVDLPGPSTQQVSPNTPAPVENAAVIPPAAAPTAATASPQPATGGRNRGLLFGVIGLIAVAAAAVLGLMFLGEGDDDSVEVVAAIPTPFPRSDTFEARNFTISIPDQWRSLNPEIPQAEARNAVEEIVVWAAPDGEAIVMFRLIDADLGGDQAFFRDTVDQYVANQYNRRVLQGVFAFIDEDTAENGMIRRSYRYTPEDRIQRVSVEFLPDTLSINAGQFDIFFVQEAPYMGVLEIYTSDEIGNRYNTRLQGVLDSLRIDPAQRDGNGDDDDDGPPRRDDD